MNILIKLTCLIGLVIAPILGSGVEKKEIPQCSMPEMEMKCSREIMGKCDMSKCATMTKEECSAMCDSLKCSPEQKEACLSHYGTDGKYIDPKECKEEGKKECCSEKK